MKTPQKTHPLSPAALRVLAKIGRAPLPRTAQIAQQITQIMGQIEKLRGMAAKAEKTGQLGRADGLRSKIRDLRQKLERAEQDHAAALHREEPLA